MRQKLITLCPTSFELAGRKANFSAWVRRKLLEEVKFTDVRYEYQCTTCNAKFFKGKSKVQGIMMVVDCIECGYGAIKTGVTE
jgi:DNA-directed RNA polymerase subunit RPC12/RpoP